MNKFLSILFCLAWLVYMRADVYYIPGTKKQAQDIPPIVKIREKYIIVGGLIEGQMEFGGVAVSIPVSSVALIVHTPDGEEGEK